MKKIFSLFAAVLFAGSMMAKVSEIKFTAAAAAGDIAEDATYTAEGTQFILTLHDSGNKMVIDANNANFGTAEGYTKYSFRMKSNGASSTEKNFFTLSIPEAGTLRIAARSASGTATDRILTIEQGVDTLYNAVVQDADSILVPAGESVVKVFPYVEVAVAAGEVRISYSAAMNFYSFALFTPADGYYLAGNFNGVAKWGVDDLSADVKFVENNTAESRPGEMVLKGVTLTAGDEFKIAQVKNGAIDDADWYGSGDGNNNFVVTDAYAGVKDIYFVPTWQDDWNGHIYVADHTPTAVANVAAEIKAIKRIENGQLVIIKNGVKYNAVGTVVR